MGLPTDILLCAPALDIVSRVPISPAVARGNAGKRALFSHLSSQSSLLNIAPLHLLMRSLQRKYLKMAWWVFQEYQCIPAFLLLLIYIYIHIDCGCKFLSGQNGSSILCHAHLYSFQLTKLEMVGTHVLTRTDSNWEHLHVIKIFHAPLHRINENPTKYSNLRWESESCGASTYAVTRNSDFLEPEISGFWGFSMGICSFKKWVTPPWPSTCTFPPAIAWDGKSWVGEDASATQNNKESVHGGMAQIMGPHNQLHIYIYIYILYINADINAKRKKECISDQVCDSFGMPVVSNKGIICFIGMLATISPNNCTPCDVTPEHHHLVKETIYSIYSV